MTVKYTTVGSVRGACGHEHRTLRAAEACVMRDVAGCRAQGGYSDRSVRHSDGSRLSESEQDALIAAPARGVR